MITAHTAHIEFSCAPFRKEYCGLSPSWDVYLQCQQFRAFFSLSAIPLWYHQYFEWHPSQLRVRRHVSTLHLEINSVYYGRRAFMNLIQLSVGECERPPLQGKHFERFVETVLFHLRAKGSRFTALLTKSHTCLTGHLKDHADQQAIPLNDL